MSGISFYVMQTAETEQSAVREGLKYLLASGHEWASCSGMSTCLYC